MTRHSTFLVLGATGGTGRHFVVQSLANGHSVRALVRSSSSKSIVASGRLDVRQGSITEPFDIDELVRGTDFIVMMVGDKKAQRSAKLNTAFVKKLVPAMRRQQVTRFLYQAGGLSRPYEGSLSLPLWILRNSVARSFIGQHEDNEGVMAYLATEASDIEWIVHRASIGSDGASKGVLRRSDTRLSVATFRDCADYNYRTVMDLEAVHSCSFSCYV